MEINSEYTEWPVEIELPSDIGGTFVIGFYLNYRQATDLPTVTDADKIIYIDEENFPDDVFRDYTDNYTGYRNYRRQMASEWEIVNDKAKASYEEWKKTAKGLKSDFDKFYGGGIVD